jgi:hypothetical protein
VSFLKRIVRWIRGQWWNPTYLHVPSDLLEEDLQRQLFACRASIRDIHLGIVMCNDLNTREAVERVLTQLQIPIVETDLEEYFAQKYFTPLEYEIVISAMARLNGGRRLVASKFEPR